MEDRDPVIALQACITAIRRNEVNDGSTVDRLHQCLRRVGDALRERDREIEWLREALEQRDSEQRSREAHLQWEYDQQHLEQSNGSGRAAGDGDCTEMSSESAPHHYWQGTVTMAEDRANVGGVGVALDQGTDTSGQGLEPVCDRTTEPVHENMTVLDQTSRVSECEMMQHTIAPDCLMQEPHHATTEGVVEMKGEGSKGDGEGEREEEMREGVSVVGVDNASGDIERVAEAKVMGLQGGEGEGEQSLMNTAVCVHGEGEEGGGSTMETEGEGAGRELGREDAGSRTEEHGIATSEQSYAVSAHGGDEGTMVAGGGGTVEGASGVVVGEGEKVESASGVEVGESEKVEGASDVVVGESEKVEGASGVEVGEGEKVESASGVVGEDEKVEGASGVGVGEGEKVESASGVGVGEGEKVEGASDVGIDESEGYRKVEFATLFYHATTGYYYDPATQQFFAPATRGYQATEQSNPEVGQASTQSGNPTETVQQSTYQSGPAGSSTGQTSSVADILAAVSEHASQKCGYSYDETAGMYYDHRYAMYYDQDSQLYYDPESGTYYEYDSETRQYQVHSRVKLPKKRRRSKPEDGTGTVIDLCSSESENEGSLEEGEIQYPRYPEGSPPPEEEWAPCLRLVVSSSECVPRGSVFVVTQDGAKLGREPEGPNPVTLHEVQVSKSHVEIKYSRTNKCFTICDLASQNGTLLNNKRLSEPKQRSKPHPLTHCDTLTIGTTSFTLHIHTGWDTCEYCRWEERGGVGEEEGERTQEGKTQWKKELNRIKKRYGLRLKDTYGEEPVRNAEGYQDRAAGRRQTVGSDMPELSYPDAPPSSVHRALAEDSVGHKMLQKLGWKKGEGLGKNSKGMTEPVQADVRGARSGLGSTVGVGKRSLDAAGSESAAKHHRLMKHYTEVMARETRKNQ